MNMIDPKLWDMLDEELKATPRERLNEDCDRALDSTERWLDALGHGDRLSMATVERLSAKFSVMAAEIKRLKAERAELLEACRVALAAFDDPEPIAYKVASQKCKAAIAKAKEMT